MFYKIVCKSPGRYVLIIFDSSISLFFPNQVWENSKKSNWMLWLEQLGGSYEPFMHDWHITKKGKSEASVFTSLCNRNINGAYYFATEMCYLSKPLLFRVCIVDIWFIFFLNSNKDLPQKGTKLRNLINELYPWWWMDKFKCFLDSLNSAKTTEKKTVLTIHRIDLLSINIFLYFISKFETNNRWRR